MDKTENVNEIFRDENYILTSTNETQNIIIDTRNTTIQNFKQKILIRENQLKKLFFTPFIVSHQRNPKFFDPERFSGTRDKFKFIKFNIKTKFQTNDDWYFTEKKLNYVLSRFKFSFRTNFFKK